MSIFLKRELVYHRKCFHCLQVHLSWQSFWSDLMYCATFSSYNRVSGCSFGCSDRLCKVMVFQSTPEPMWLYSSQYCDSFSCSATWGHTHSTVVSSLGLYGLSFPQSLLTILSTVDGKRTQFCIVLSWEIHFFKLYFGTKCWTMIHLCLQRLSSYPYNASMVNGSCLHQINVVLKMFLLPFIEFYHFEQLIEMKPCFKEKTILINNMRCMVRECQSAFLGNKETQDRKVGSLFSCSVAVVTHLHVRCLVSEQ